MINARCPRRGERGAVLVEFALVALAFTVLAGAVFDFGRAFYAAQQVQQAARVAAREIALLPLPPAGVVLRDALDCTRADALGGAGPCAPLAAAPALPRETVFDPDFLAVPCAVVETAGFSCASDAGLDAFFSRLPVVNQLLRPLMIFDRTDACADPSDPPCLIRYPGALVATSDPESATGLSVVIPLQAADGTYTCVDVVEAVSDDFSAALGGRVSLRINYPFQAAALLGWRIDEGASLPIAAEDPGACAGLSPGLAPRETPGMLATAGIGPYTGELGLGRHFALGQVVRPFRRVVSAEASFRREVYL